MLTVEDRDDLSDVGVIARLTLVAALVGAIVGTLIGILSYDGDDGT